MVIVLSVPVALADIYKWVDDEGRVQYSDTPPGENQGERVEVRDQPDQEDIEEARARLDRLVNGDSDPEDDPTDEPATQASSVEADDQARRRNCEMAKRNLRYLEQQRPVYRTNADGEREYLDDGARSAQVDLARTHIAKYCSS